MKVLQNEAARNHRIGDIEHSIWNEGMQAMQTCSHSAEFQTGWCLKWWSTVCIDLPRPHTQTVCPRQSAQERALLDKAMTSIHIESTNSDNASKHISSTLILWHYARLLYWPCKPQDIKAATDSSTC
jgi:hypothetical protein